MTSDLDVQRWVGSAAEFHARPLAEDGRVHLWSFEVDRPAIVLGSSQSDEVVDDEACARADVEVVRRRSGGGAVLLVPDHVVWLDVVIPVDHERWHDDVGRATWWLGSAWRDALVALGVADPTVHHGAMVATPWSPLVCFAGLGPGEVTATGRKLVGISQRRTRRAARFQCAVQLVDVTDRLLTLLAPTGLDRATLTGVGSLADVAVTTTPERVQQTLVEAIERSLRVC